VEAVWIIISSLVTVITHDLMQSPKEQVEWLTSLSVLFAAKQFNCQLMFPIHGFLSFGVKCSYFHPNIKLSHTKCLHISYFQHFSHGHLILSVDAFTVPLACTYHLNLLLNNIAVIWLGWKILCRVWREKRLILCTVFT
jgi:ABC-type multidrug transport system permease subunit